MPHRFPSAWRIAGEQLPAARSGGGHAVQNTRSPSAPRRHQRLVAQYGELPEQARRRRAPPRARRRCSRPAPAGRAAAAGPGWRAPSSGGRRRRPRPASRRSKWSGCSWRHILLTNYISVNILFSMKPNMQPFFDPATRNVTTWCTTGRPPRSSTRCSTTSRSPRDDTRSAERVIEFVSNTYRSRPHKGIVIYAARATELVIFDYAHMSNFSIKIV